MNAAQSKGLEPGYFRSRYCTRNRMPRRAFLLAAGVGVGGGVLSPSVAADSSLGQEGFIPFDENIKLAVSGKREDILDKAYNLGFEYHKTYGHCCRCVTMALQHSIEFVPKHAGLYRAATALSASAVPGRRHNCGAFNAAGIVIGYMCGQEPFGKDSLGYRLIRQVAQKFLDTYGSVICEDIVKSKDTCPEKVGNSARWTAEALLAQFAQ